MQLTMLGRKDAYDQLDDFSLAAQRDMVRWLQQTAQELEANFPYEHSIVKHKPRMTYGCIKLIVTYVLLNSST